MAAAMGMKICDNLHILYKWDSNVNGHHSVQRDLRAVRAINLEMDSQKTSFDIFSNLFLKNK